MKKKSRIPTYSKIIAMDYPAFLASLIPIVLFLCYLVLLIIQRSLEMSLDTQLGNAIGGVLIALTLGLVIYQLYRVWLIRRVFQHGSDVQGRITTVSPRRMRIKVGYSYSFGQNRVSSTATLRANAETKNLRKGGRVLVVVDRNQPKRAYLRDLYR